MNCSVSLVIVNHVQHSTHAAMHSLTMAHQQAIFDLMRQKQMELQELKKQYEAKQLSTVLEFTSISVIDPLGVEHKLMQVPHSFSVSFNCLGLLNCTSLTEHHDQELGSIILGRYTRNPAMVTFLQGFLATDRFQVTMDGDLTSNVLTEERLSVLENDTTVIINVVFIKLRKPDANIMCPLRRRWIPLQNGDTERVLW